MFLVIFLRTDILTLFKHEPGFFFPIGILFKILHKIYIFFNRAVLPNILTIVVKAMSSPPLPPLESPLLLRQLATKTTEAEAKRHSHKKRKIQSNMSTTTTFMRMSLQLWLQVMQCVRSTGFDISFLYHYWKYRKRGKWYQFWNASSLCNYNAGCTYLFRSSFIGSNIVWKVWEKVNK